MDISSTRQQPHMGSRGGATVLAVLLVMTIVCLMAHQTVRTLFLLRQGQTASAKLAQALEVLELGKMLERQSREGDSSPMLAGPIVVEFGQGCAKLEFSTAKQPAVQDSGLDTLKNSENENDSDALEATENTDSKPIAQIKATWPVASNGAELSSEIPIVVTYDVTIHDFGG